MASHKLTDAQCRRAPAPEKLKKLMDGHGLFLAILPSGAKIWRQNYRLHQKPQTEVFGPYPMISLAEARARSVAFRKQLLDGLNPKALYFSSPAFSQACTDYWATRQDVTPRYILNATRGLAMHLYPSLGNAPVNTITRAMLLAPLMVLNAQAKFVYARRVRLWASHVLGWAKAQGYCPDNVAEQIDPKATFGRAKVKHHAFIEAREVHALFERVALEKELQSVLALKMIALTWVRTGELRLMTWDQIEGDLWRLPVVSMKKSRLHLVPLSHQALTLLAKLKERCQGSKYVFPNDRRQDRPMSENSVLYLLGRIGYKGLMTGHGWRHVASTWANERGYNGDAVEMALAHSSGNAVRVVYNHAAYLPQRRELLQDFANWLDDANAGRAQGGQAPALGLA